MNFIKTTLLGITLALAGAAWAAPIDINSADAKALEALNGVGPAKAEAIVDYRIKNGPFKTVDDLEKVSGIGKATVDKNRDNLTVGGGAKSSGKAEKTAGAKKDSK
ncbi:MAG: hypothetical protein NVS9B10_00230 [Nevskia sp.]